MKSIAIALIFAGPIVAADRDSTTPDAAALTAILQPMMVQNLKSPVLESKSNWGHQKEFTVAWDLKRQGPLNWKNTPVKEKLNDGAWTHLSLDVPDVAKNLKLDISKVTSPEAGRTLIEAAIRSPRIDLTIQQQTWKRGLRVLSNETRAHCVGAVHLDLEMTTRFVTTPGQLLPDPVVTFKVTKAEIYYHDLKVTHTLGVGGDAAKIIGEATLRILKEFKPNLEKDLLAKAEAAIVKAGKSKEVKVSLGTLGKK
jgi:hypothetical protein